MNKPTQDKLTIVIPCKNEVNFIGKLFDSLEKQSFDLSQTVIYVADAKSNDGTRKVIESYRNKGYLKIEIAEGGYPAFGRNCGAAKSSSEYLLFLDADIQLLENDFIEAIVNEADQNNLNCIGTLVKSTNANWKDKIIWKGLTGTMYLYSLIKPFSSGMCIFMRRSKFIELGGFNEKVILGEDVELTSKISKQKFRIVRRHVLTTNRRFEQMGYMKTMSLYARTLFSKSFRHEDNAYYFQDCQSKNTTNIVEVLKEKI